MGLDAGGPHSALSEITRQPLHERMGHGLLGKPGPPTVETVASSFTMSGLADKPYVPQTMRGDLAAAQVAFLPTEERMGVAGPMFHAGSGDLYKALASGGIKATIPVEKAAYRELVLHADQLWVPTLLVLWPYAKDAIAIIDNWIRMRQLRRFEETQVEFDYAVEGSPTGNHVIRYRGAATNFKRVMDAAVSALEKKKPE